MFARVSRPCRPTSRLVRGPVGALLVALFCAEGCSTRAALREVVRVLVSVCGLAGPCEGA